MLDFQVQIEGELEHITNLTFRADEDQFRERLAQLRRPAAERERVPTVVRRNRNRRRMFQPVERDRRRIYSGDSRFAAIAARAPQSNE